VATRVFQAVLETTASEMSSKMVAMKSATENAEELIDDSRSRTTRSARPTSPRDDRDRVRRPGGALGAHGGMTRTMATAAPTATGRVIQITGPVVDIEFPAGKLPQIYNAVEIVRPVTSRSSARSSRTWGTTGSAPWR